MVDELVFDDNEKSEISDLIEELEYEKESKRSATDDEIVRRYQSAQGRISIQRNDFLVPNILEMIKDRSVMNIAPPYQRRYRWTTKKQSQLIESLLMNVPIPPVFLYEVEYAKYEVMDGQQRLSAIRAFFGNEFRLTGLNQWPELNGRTYRDLPSMIQSGLSRRSLAAVIVLTESGQTQEAAMKLRQYVFERLNTGGQPLNAQEVRNCIYDGPFNTLLIELSRSDQFTRAWGIPPREHDEPHKVSRSLEKNRLYSAMLDCEIVLRYFALADMTKFTGGMKRALDKTMERYRPSDTEVVARLKMEYLSVLDMALEIYGPSVFKLISDSGTLTGRRSVPLSDAILTGLSKVRDKWPVLSQKKEYVKASTVELMQDEARYNVITAKGNTKKEIVERLTLFEKFYSDLAQ